MAVLRSDSTIGGVNILELMNSERQRLNETNDKLIDLSLSAQNQIDALWSEKQSLSSDNSQICDYLLDLDYHISLLKLGL